MVVLILLYKKLWEKKCKKTPPLLRLFGCYLNYRLCIQRLENLSLHFLTPCVRGEWFLKLRKFRTSSIPGLKFYSWLNVLFLVPWFKVIFLSPNLMNFSRVSSPKDRFHLSAGLNLETLTTILVEPTIFEPRLKSRGSNTSNSASGLKFYSWLKVLFLV